MSGKEWNGRKLPLQVAIDKREPNLIPGTKLQTGGATHAAFRVLQARRGYVTPSLTLLIDPKGIIQQAFQNRPSLRELQNAIGLAGQEQALLAEYALAEGEVLKRRAPPYSQARRDYHLFRSPGRGEATMTFEQGDTLRQRWSTFGDATLQWVVGNVVGVRNYEYKDPDKVLERPIAGDWCIRTASTREERLKALEQILSSEMKWKVRFERKPETRPVIVATGDWKPVPLPGAPDPAKIYLTVEEPTEATSSGGGSVSFGRMLIWLGERLKRHVISEVADPPAGDLRIADHLLRDMDDLRSESDEGKAKLAKLLQQLEHQTGLTFRQETRDVDIWQIVAEE